MLCIEEIFDIYLLDRCNLALFISLQLQETTKLRFLEGVDHEIGASRSREAGHNENCESDILPLSPWLKDRQATLLRKT